MLLPSATLPARFVEWLNWRQYRKAGEDMSIRYGYSRILKINALAAAEIEKINLLRPL